MKAHRKEGAEIVLPHVSGFPVGDCGKRDRRMGLKPDLTAGLSLGEYCALVASDVMSFEDAVKVVRQRGILMQDTVPAGEGAMSAVLGMKKEAIEAVLPDVEGIVTIANYNCPGQIVISGESKAVAEAGEALKEAGAKRVLPLKVSGPFHSPMLNQLERNCLMY